MGERYHPEYRNTPPRFGRDDDRYGPRYDGRDYYDRPRRSPSPRRYPRSDRYEQNYDEYGRNDEFTFRGAAERANYRPREEEFTFRSHGPPAPRFPPREQPPRPQRSHPPRRHDQSQDQANQGLASYHRGRTHEARGRFGRLATHQRQLLQRRGGSTPEQLPGMNDGETRFMDLESSEEDNNVIDLTNDSGEEGEIVPRKRAKVEHSEPAEAITPKWSNPEYFTALPPPDLGAPKKDIVQVIRKAKVEAGTKSDSSNAVKDNVDFISFNIDDEIDNIDDFQAAAVGHPPVDAPTGPSSSRGRARADLPAKNAVNGYSVSIGFSDAVGSPPEPSPDLVMPTDRELAAHYGGDTKGKKRKREEQSKGLGDVVPEWQLKLGINPTPWCTVNHSNTTSTGLRSLHKEIADFFDFVRPHEYEEAIRRELIERVQRAVRSAPPKLNSAGTVEIRSFGSFAAGLYLPTADMDLVAVSPGYLSYGIKSFCQSIKQLHFLANHIGNVSLAAFGTVSPVAKAKVPIVKFTDKKSGIKVDISFENDSGLKATKTFLKWKEQYPAMPIIVVLIKQMLAMRNMNEVFSGGLGGFSVICLVVSMMQMMPQLQVGSMDPEQHYGELLLNFLDLYGNKFDMRTTGIVMEPPGYFDKILNPTRTRNKQNEDGLTIIDPNDQGNDISGGSRNVQAIFNCFRTAHSEIQRRLAQINSGQRLGESVLGCIWGGNYTSFIHQRNKLSLIHDGQAVSSPPGPEPRQQQPKPRRLPPQSKQLRPPPPPAPATQQRNPRPPPTKYQRQPPEMPVQSGRDSAQGRAQHTLPQKPMVSAENGPLADRGGYVTLYVDPIPEAKTTHTYSPSNEQEKEINGRNRPGTIELNGPNMFAARKPDLAKDTHARNLERAAIYNQEHPEVSNDLDKLSADQAKLLYRIDDMTKGFSRNTD